MLRTNIIPVATIVASSMLRTNVIHMVTTVASSMLRTKRHTCGHYSG